MLETDDTRHRAYDRRTRGQKLSDQISQYAGSWPFIIIFLVWILGWVLLNGFLLATKPWDPFPFILLNLTLSTVAALQAPIILMSQNRAAQRDRRKAEMDLAVDRKAEQEISEIQEELKEIKHLLQSKKPPTRS
jgi:uncharacterized membrane protein